MKTGEAIREIMKKQDVGITKIANRLGKSKSVVSERVRQDNISVAKLDEILRVLDYKIVLVPLDTSTPKDSFEIK